MKNGIILAALMTVILTLGCCCIPSGNGGSTTTLPALTCNPPYIEVGSDCCIDVNYDGVCDTDVATQPTTIATTIPTTMATTIPTTIPTTQATTMATTIPTTRITTTTLGSKAKCAIQEGVTPDTVIYLYNDACCKSLTTTSVNPVKNKGYKFKMIDVDSISYTEQKVIDCYLSGDIFIPQFICARTGDSILMANPSGARSKIETFAEECEN